MKPHLQYVNSTMDEIDELTRDLYEALADGDTDTAKAIIKQFNKTLTDIKKSLNEEVH